MTKISTKSMFFKMALMSYLFSNSIMSMENMDVEEKNLKKKNEDITDYQGNNKKPKSDHSPLLRNNNIVLKNNNLVYHSEAISGYNRAHIQPNMLPLVSPMQNQFSYPYFQSAGIPFPHDMSDQAPLTQTCFKNKTLLDIESANYLKHDNVLPYNQQKDFESNEFTDKSKRKLPKPGITLYWKDIISHFGLDKWSDELDIKSNNHTRDINVNFDDLKNKIEINRCLKKILTEGDYSKIISKNEFKIPNKFIYNEVQKIIDISKNEPIEFQEGLKEFTLRLIALRIIKEIRECEMEYPWREPAPSDFNKLCSYSGYFCSKEEGDFKGSNQKIGMTVLAGIMDKLRIKTTKINQDSPNEIFNSFKIMGKLLSKVKDAYNLEIKKINKKKEKDAKISNYLPRNDKGGDCTNITKGILRHSVEEGKSAGQFRSTFVKDLLKFLIIKYNRKIETIVDLSAGWGDRLLGCLASVSTFGLKRYVATDPNVDLQEAYKEICEQFPPINHKLSGELTDLEGGGFRYTYTSSYPSSDPLLSQTTYSKTPPVFSAILYPFALEDLSEEQLKPDNRDNDLVFTSIPYFNQELYAVGKQSYETYPTYAEWRDGFLVNFVSQSVKALKNNGFIAVNSAPIKNKTGQHEITNDLENILTNYKKDNVQLKKVANFWYMGKPDSNTLIFEKVVS